MVADELMTTRELEDFLRVDRTTIYNMLNDGRLSGFKVGGQWRFSRQEIESWMRGQREEKGITPLSPSPDAFPLDCIYSIQSIFAEAIKVGSIITRLDGQALTEISNSCAFCDLILSTPEGFQRCAKSWRALAGQIEQKPRLHQCHAGLLYARGRIEVEDEFLAMVFAGQIVVDGALETVTADVEKLATACALDPVHLRDALPSVRSFTADSSGLLMNLLERMAKTLSDIGRERLVLLRKLRHIAEVTSL